MHALNDNFTEIGKKLKLIALKKLAQVAAIQGSTEVALSPANILFLVQEVEDLNKNLEDIKQIVAQIYWARNQINFENWCKTDAHPKLFEVLEIFKESDIEKWKKSIKEISIKLFKGTTKFWSIFSPLDAGPAKSSLQFWRRWKKISEM